MFPLAALAIICAGGVYSAIGANIAPSDATYQAKLVRPKAMITSEKQYDAAKKMCELAGIPLSKIYVLNSESGHHDIYNAETQGSLVRNKQLEWERISDGSILRSRTACILFTSGTSGYPK
jgi:acyl-coenzyme A synthetase/AMP-(fatty) acid ligase